MSHMNYIFSNWSDISKSLFLILPDFSFGKHWNAKYASQNTRKINMK